MCNSCNTLFASNFVDLGPYEAEALDIDAIVSDLDLNGGGREAWSWGIAYLRTDLSKTGFLLVFLSLLFWSTLIVTDLDFFVCVGNIFYPASENLMALANISYWKMSFHTWYIEL